MRPTMRKMLFTGVATLAVSTGSVSAASAATARPSDEGHHGGHSRHHVDTEIKDIGYYVYLRHHAAYVRVSYRCDSDADYSSLEVRLKQGDTSGTGRVRHVHCSDYHTETVWVRVKADHDHGDHDDHGDHGDHDGFDEGRAWATAKLTTYTDGDRDSDSESDTVRIVD